MSAPGTVVCDLDGVVWLDGRALPGAADAVGRLRSAGYSLLFATNNSSRKVGNYLDMLGAAGIPAVATEVLTSAQAAAHVLGPTGGRVLPCAGPGVIEAVEAVGLAVVHEWPCDAVVVGWSRDFDFDMLRRASDAVRRGARFVATNLDATYPSPDGLLPGGGAIVAAVAAASGADPEVAGKPCRPTVDLIRARSAPGDSWVVGDRWSTDGALAAALAWPFALVASEVTGSEPAGGLPEPAVAAPSLAMAVDAVLGVGRSMSGH